MRLLVKSEAEAGALDDAAAAASAISDESDAARAAVDVAVANFRAGHAMAGAQWLVRAQQIAANASVPATKAEATADIAGASAVAGMDLKSKGQIEEARAAAEKETSDVLRAAIYEAIARALARSGKTDDAIALLRDKAPKMIGPVLTEIADDRIAARQWGDAFAALEAIPNDNMRASLMIELAGKLPQ